MIRDELSRALRVLGDRLPGGRVVVLMRRAYGDHGVTFVRGDVEAVTGHPVSAFEAPTSRWAEIVHPDDREGVLDRLGRLPDVEELHLEYRVEDPDGGVRWLREDLRVRRLEPEAPPEVVGLLTDATFERTIRTRVSRLEEQLWRSRKLESVGTMATGVAHDFNNLLTVVLAAADLLRHEPDLPDESLQDVRVIREAANRGAELIKQILSFAARRPKRVESVDVAELVEELDRILGRAAGERVHLTIEAADDCWPVEVDRAHIEQIVFNLVSNARDAMEGDGSLRVRVGNWTVEERLDLERGRLRPGRYVRISVEDTGPGMEEEVRRRLFEPFFSTKGGGTGKTEGGFGLSTVLRLVRGYGGGIDVESEPGEGSAFRIYLPVREESREEVSRARVRGAVEEPAPGKARILVVEDDEKVRAMVERTLERAGHAVVACGTVREGLQVFDRVRPPFDLLVADVLLPDRSGADLQRAARRRVPDLPVVFMSGYDRETLIREGVSDPTVPLLEKPLSSDELLEAVRRALEQNGGDRSDELPDAGEGGR